MNRPIWSEYFLRMASVSSTRSTCVRAKVGCVLVDGDHNIVTTGYNGSPSGLPHCDEVGCLEHDGHCKRATHAERNALLQAARKGSSTAGCTAYVTHRPCLDCFRDLISAGVTRIIYQEAYGADHPEYAEWAAHKNVQFYEVGK